MRPKLKIYLLFVLNLGKKFIDIITRYDLLKATLSITNISKKYLQFKPEKSHFEASNAVMLT